MVTLRGPREAGGLAELALTTDCLALSLMSPFARPSAGHWPMRRQEATVPLWPDLIGGHRGRSLDGGMQTGIRSIPMVVLDTVIHIGRSDPKRAGNMHTSLHFVQPTLHSAPLKVYFMKGIPPHDKNSHC